MMYVVLINYGLNYIRYNNIKTRTPSSNSTKSPRCFFDQF